MTTLEAFEKLWNHSDVMVVAKVGGFDVMLGKDRIADIYADGGRKFVKVLGMERQQIEHETMNLYHDRFYNAKRLAREGREQRLLDKVNNMLS